MTSPYFYVIRHKTSGKKYAGCRTAIGCDPAELLSEGGYHTSSKSVKRLIEMEGLKSFEILEIVTDLKDVYEYETLFLKENNCSSSDAWLNLHDNTHILPMNHPKFKEHVSRLYGVQNASQSPVVKERVKRTKIKRYGKDYTKHAHEKMQQTMLEKHRVKFPSQLIHNKEKARLRKLLEVKDGLHWCQQKENKQLIRERTLKQASEGKLYLQSEKGRKEQSIRRAELNKSQNAKRSNRLIVKEVAGLFKRNNIKLPHGGINNRTDAWLEEVKESILSGTYFPQKKKYYNDGIRNYMLFDHDPKIANLTKGMVKRIKQIGDV